MIKPTMEVARGMASDYTVIPICFEFLSDIKTPIQVLKCLKSMGKPCYLLESVEGGEKWGRYSFLGFEPELSVKCKNGKGEIKSGLKIEAFSENPKDVIRNILSLYKSPGLDFLPTFTGGFVGYISYEFAKYFHSFQNESTNHMTSYENEYDSQSSFDDINLMLFDKIIAFDHLRQKIMIIVNIKTDDLETNYINGVLKIKEIELIVKSDKPSPEYRSCLLSDFIPLFSKEHYCNMVEKVKEYIHEGDIFQAVIANRWEAKLEGDLLSAFRLLRTINPSPYMFYIDFEEVQIVGASPETLVSLKDGKLSTFPIAGTCRRGKTEEEDEEFIKELMQNEKELAEHNMLVDLGRNDLGRVSQFGTVKLEKYKEILKFSHVSHISSTVTGVLSKGLDQLDAIGAVLPAGTLSGAPKTRAMEIINELEIEPRGVYGGAIGYIDFSGNMDLCIAIRMAIKIKDKVHVSAGAGIVADSIAENEYMECVNKAKAMMEAIKHAGEVE